MTSEVISKPMRTSPSITAAIRSATATCFALSPSHAVTFSTLADLNDVSVESHARATSMLNNTIGLLTTMKGLVGLQIVKDALLAVSALLILVRDTMVNKNDLVELSFYCARICFVLRRGTFGRREEDINPSLLVAISDLKNTVKDIQDDITQNIRLRFHVRVLHSKTDKDKLQAWRQVLDRILQVFHTEMHVVAGLKLDIMSDQLSCMQKDLNEFKELCKLSAFQPIPLLGEHPPLPPELFVGRDDLVREVVDCMIKRMHVALVGPGGIGKTSVARTVLNDGSIKDHFHDKRYFVRCDNFVISHDKFLDRIAQVTGARLSQSNPLSSFRAFLASLTSPLLLVLDNTETVQDAPTDIAEMADLIDEIGSCPAVSLMLTTRNATLSSNIILSRIDVPPLGKDAAMDAFFAVYRYERPSSAIEKLLDEVDRHPLSINLLARAGAQNGWPVLELVEQWKRQRTRLLDDDNNVDKTRSLAISIELSLNSPTMQKLGDDALHILQVISFLPQGVDGRKLKELFPSVPNVRSIVDTLRKLSLTHRNGDFVTMLAPIRLYMQIANLSVPPLLQHVRNFYYARLVVPDSSVPGVEGIREGTWIVSEDDNLEKLIVYYFSTSENLLETCRACSSFLSHLYHRKPRRTILKDIIQGIPEHDVLAFWKADCLETIGWIAYTMGRYAESAEVTTSARNIFLAHGDWSHAAQCLMDLADTNFAQGKLVDAGRLDAEALAECLDLQDHAGEARCNEMLGRIARLRGKLPEASHFLTKAREYYESKQETWNVGFMRTELGNLEFARGNHLEGRGHFERAVVIFTDTDDDHHVGWSLQQFARAECILRNWPKAHRLLDRARAHYLKIGATLQAARCLRERGHAYCYQKELPMAREYLAQAQDVFSLVDSIIDQAMCVYDLAWVEFYHEDSKTAKVLLARAKEWFADVGDIYWEAYCDRSLGEVAFLEKDYEGAQMLFMEANHKYEVTGLSPAKTDEGHFYLGEGLKGWQSFRQGHLGLIMSRHDAE